MKVEGLPDPETVEVRPSKRDLIRWLREGGSIAILSDGCVAILGVQVTDRCSCPPHSYAELRAKFPQLPAPDKLPRMSLDDYYNPFRQTGTKAAPGAAKAQPKRHVGRLTY